MKQFLLGLLLGAAGGAGVTYIFMKKKIDEMSTWVYDDLGDDIFDDEEEDDEGTVIINPQAELQLSEGARSQENYTRYHDMSKKHKETEEDEEGDVMSEKEIEEAEGRRLTEEAEEIGDDIFIIDQDDFGSKPQFDTTTLMYYVHDGVLTTEEDEIIDDINGTVGEECVDILDAGEADSIFIRNGRLATDYEVIRLSATYGE